LTWQDVNFGLFSPLKYPYYAVLMAADVVSESPTGIFTCVQGQKHFN